MTRELSVDWPWPGEWESVEDVSAFYKDRLYPALSDYVGGLAESDVYIDYVTGPFTIGDITIGSVLFASTGGEVSQDNDDFFWDATNIRLGIDVGTSPSVTLDVGGDCKFDGAVTINDANADKDFRVEGSGATYTHLLFTDASTNRVGINLSSPLCLAHIRGTVCADYAGVGADTFLLIENDDNVAIQLQAATTGSAYIEFCDDAYNPPAGRVAYDFANEWMEFVAATNEVFYIKDGYVTTADGIELAVGNFGTPSNPFHVQDEGTVGGWSNSTYGGVVARFRASEAKHTSVCIDAQTGYDPTLLFSENGAATWDIRNDASATDSLNIRYQVGSPSANATRLAISNVGHFDFQAGNLVTTGTADFSNTALSTTTSHVHLTNYVYKTGGASNYTDYLYGLDTYVKMDDGSNGIGYVVGINSTAWHTAGDIGDGSNSRDILGLQGQSDLDGGKVWGNAYGCYFFVDQESGHEVTGDVFALRLYSDLDGTVGGTSYMLHLFERSGIDYGIYQDGTAKIYFGGNVGIGQATFGTNATQTFAIDSGVAPTSSPADCFQMYSADIGAAAGKAGAHFRDEEGNVVSIGSGGMLMTGTARITKEIIIGSGSFHKGVSAPDDVYLANNMHVLVFDKTTVEHGHYSTLVPSDFAAGTTIGVEVDWAFADAEADHYMTWVMEYLLIADGEDPAGAITRTYQKSVISTGNNDKQIHTTFGTGITGATADDTLLIRFFRDSNATYDTDDLDQDAWLLGIHLHYIADKLGQPT